VQALKTTLADLEMMEAIMGGSPAPSDYTDTEWSALQEALREEVAKTRRQLEETQKALAN
jgi:hypothetical protein